MTLDAWRIRSCRGFQTVVDWIMANKLTLIEAARIAGVNEPRWPAKEKP